MFSVSGDSSEALLVIAEGRGAARLRELCLPHTCCPWQLMGSAAMGQARGLLTPMWCHTWCSSAEQRCLSYKYLATGDSGWQRGWWHSATRINCSTADLAASRGSCCSGDLQTMLSLGRKRCPLPPVESGPLAKVEKPKPAQQLRPRVIFPAYGLDHACFRPGPVLQASTGLKTGPHLT